MQHGHPSLPCPNKPPKVVAKEVYIINPQTNEEMTIDQALADGLIDEEAAEEYRKA